MAILTIKGSSQLYTHASLLMNMAGATLEEKTARYKFGTRNVKL